MRGLVTKTAGRGPQRRNVKLIGLGCLVAGASMVAAVVSATVPAYADVTSNQYTIGSPSGEVINFTATPSTVTAAATTSFELVFYVGAAFSGTGDGSITITPSEALGSAPSNLALISGSCVQAGTNGAGGAGTSSTTSLVIELSSSCSISSNAKVEVDFDAIAPSSTGTFSFAVTTTGNTVTGTSNTVTVGTSQVSLSAALYGFGANTTYSLSDVPVDNLSSDDTTVTLVAKATQGSETLSFLNTTASYSVTYTSSSGTASDDVTAVSASGATATLTLADGLTSGDTINITAIGTNPAASGTAQADDITVTPGNGTAETTNSIVFGGSVTGISVSPVSTLAGVTTLYTVGFVASTAAAPGGDITLSEQSGPTNFTSVTGIVVDDTTANWHFVATGATLADGSVVIPLTDAIAANDSVSVVLANVTNPPAGTIRDFAVSTSGDAVPADAASYTIGASASPGVAVTVEPTTTGAVATYTISNLRAESALAAGSSTIGLEAPANTVFPDDPSYYHIVDSTTSSGSGTVTVGVTGGGSSDVTFTVPNNVNAGDALSVTIEDVINPGTASSDDTITLVGPIEGPVPVAATTTTTTAPKKTTTTTAHKPKPKPKPVPNVALVSSTVTVQKKAVVVKLRCSRARCKGEVVLKDVTTLLGNRDFNLAATGRSAGVLIPLDKAAFRLLDHAKGHTIKARTTVTVSGGHTLATKISVKL